MTSKEFTDEVLNYFRVCYVITNDVPQGLRTVFKQQWNAKYQATHGQWLDTVQNATDFCNMESPRNQSRKANLLTIMANGNTSEWDCTCLFYALLFSDCLGPFLNITVKKHIDELREIRNDVFAHTANGRLTDVDFGDAMLKIMTAMKALGLDTTEVNEMKTQKSFPTEELSKIQQQLNTEKKRYAKLHSFCVLPPKPSHDTTDRADEVTAINHEMETLRNRKKNETTVIYLSGNPGCGKSEIARQIGNTYFDLIPEKTAQLNFVFTFNASSIDTLLLSYVEFANRLSCDEDSVTRIATSRDLTQEEKIKRLKALINPKMQIYICWLIIVDNVIDLKLVSKYLPQAGEKTSGDGQILVTTQDSQSIPLDSYAYHYPSLKIGMKEEDAIALLSHISGCPGDRDTLLNIASTLDFQPLALACAALYVQRIFNVTDQSGTNWEKCLVKLQEGKREATEKIYEKTTSTYPSAMTAAVRLALQRVVSEDEIMIHALQFVSVIANEAIPLKYVVQYVMNCMPDEDQDLVAAHVTLSSLVISSEDVERSKEIRVHQVIFHVLQKVFENDETYILKLMSVFSDLPSYESAYNPTKSEIIATRSFAPHFVVISSKLKCSLQHRCFTVQSLTADCLFKAGSICLVQGSYKASEIFLELCLSIQQSSESVALANTRKHLGQLYIYLRDFEKAQMHLAAGLIIEEKLRKEDHPELAITLKKLGFCLNQLGQLRTAEEYLKRALAIQENDRNKSYSLLAGTLVNLISLLQSQGKFKEAKTYCEKVLELVPNLYGIEDPQVAATMNDLGVYFSRLENTQEEIFCYEKALEIMESVYDGNHPSKVIALQNLGNSLLKLRNFEKAQAYLGRALSIQEKGHDTNSPQMAETLCILGGCLLEQNQYEKAKTYYERALSIYEKGDNQDDPGMANMLNNLGLCLFELKKYEKAKSYFEKALSILDKGNSENDTRLAITLGNLASCLNLLKQYEKAKAYHERALSIYEKGDNQDDPGMANMLNNLGLCLFELKKYEKAKAYHERALSIYEKGDNQDDPGMANMLNNLGLCLFELKKYEKAKSYFEKALSILDNENSENDTRLAITLGNLASCLNLLKQYEKAKAYHERALSIYEKGDNQDDPGMANMLNNLGLCLFELKKYEKAKSYFEKALSILDNENSENDTRLAITLGNLASCLNLLKKHEKAKAYHERALSIYEKGDDQDDPGTAITLNNLGLCLLELEKYERAKAYFERALSIYEKGDNQDDPGMANMLNNLGLCLFELKKYEKAKSYFEKALSILDKGNSENDTRLAITLGNLASCLNLLKQYEKAKAYHERAQYLRKKKGDEKDQ